MARALLDGRPYGVFVAIEHPSGTGYFHTGVGTRTWNGHSWTGAGTLGSIAPVTHSTTIAVQDIVFAINGVDSSLIAQLNDVLYNRNGSAWLACFDENDRVIPDPYQIVNATLDFQTFKIAPDGTASIEITAHTGFYTLDRSVDEAWTPQNQRLTYPLDSGLDMIPSLVNQDLTWSPS
jgi:hypothetical protein